jgi:UDP-glucose 4-epimerase
MRPELLVTGASGALARLVAQSLAPSWKVVGVDPRPERVRGTFPGEYIQAEYNHRKMDEVFVNHDFKGLIHLGRIRETAQVSATERFQLNVVGTKRLLDLARRAGVPKIVVLSTYHVYGAHRLNSLYLKEDAPLRASQTFQELADAVEMDHAATNFMWRERESTTVVLRAANVVGKRVQNTICTMLRSGLAPRVLGFDPLFQFIDEQDMARAVIVSLNAQGSGVYNVAGEGVLSYSKAIELSRALPIPVPPLGLKWVGAALSRAGLSIPRYLFEYFKYPVVMNDSGFQKTFHFQPKVETASALKSLALGRERPVYLPKP